MMKKILHILIMCFFAAASAYAQSDTLKDARIFQNAASDDTEYGGGQERQSQALEIDTVGERLRALQGLYYAGKYNEALELSHEIRNRYRLNKSENLLRLKYTTSAFKDLEYHREADSTAELFLLKDPFYTADAADPAVFRDILSNYYTKPEFSVWLAAGKILAAPILDTVRTIIDTVQLDPKYEIGGFSIQLGFEYRPFKIFSVSFAPALISYTIKRNMNRTEIAVFHYNETSSILSLPLFAEAGLYLRRGIIVPSAYFGAQLKYVMKAKYKAYTEAPGFYTEIPSDYQIDTENRNRLNYSILGGLRLNFNRQRITYFFDLGFSTDVLHYNDPSKKYCNYDLLYQNHYIPDMYRMFELTVKAGIKVNMKYKAIAKYNYGHN